MIDPEAKPTLTQSDLVNYAIGLESLRQSNKNDIRESQKSAHSLLNSTNSDLSKNLFLVASILIPLISAVVGSAEVRTTLGQTGILLVKEAIILTLSSIAFGFLHIIFESKYYEKWLGNCDERLQLWSKTAYWPSNPNKLPQYIEEYESIRKESDSIQNILPKKGTEIAIFLQGLSLFLAVILISVAAFGLMKIQVPNKIN